MTPFAAVLLAGGRSRRMGRDKALLPLPDGSLLWERQFTVLRELHPAALFISGARRSEFPPEVVCLTDETPGRGPLGGIVAALHAAPALPRLVVLAIDLPAMTSTYLQRLLDETGEARGTVPRHPNTGFFEPLAAVYPRQILSTAEARLQGEDRSMHGFIRAVGDCLSPFRINPPDLPLFRNWNEPATDTLLAGDGWT